MRFIFPALVCFIFFEIYLLFCFGAYAAMFVGSGFSFLLTIFWCFYSFSIGKSLIKRFLLSGSLNSQMRGSQRISDKHRASVCSIFSGILLMFPGLITDFIGLILLIPIVQSLLFRLVYQYFVRHIIQKNSFFYSTNMKYSHFSKGFHQDHVDKKDKNHDVIDVDSEDKS